MNKVTAHVLCRLVFASEKAKERDRDCMGLMEFHPSGMRSFISEEKRDLFFNTTL